MKIGIYKITNIITNAIYIGSSVKIKKRWWRHVNDLKNKKHDNIHLQRSWNKYGEDKFKFEIIKECLVEDLLKIEQNYLDKMNWETSFNIGKKACGGDNLSKNPNRELIIEKIRNALLKRYRNMSKQEKSEKFGKKGKDNSNYGNKWTPDQKKAQSKRAKKYFKENECYRSGKTNIELFGKEKAREISEKISKHASQRTGSKNPFYNKEHSDITKERMRQSKIGKYSGNQNIPFKINGIKYNSLGEASKELNIPTTTIRWRLKSKNNKFNNYKTN